MEILLYTLIYDQNKTNENTRIRTLFSFYRLSFRLRNKKKMMEEDENNVIFKEKAIIIECKILVIPKIVPIT